MRVHGIVIQPAQQQAILAEMTDGFELGRLTGVAVRAGVPSHNGNDPVAMRTADRMIQKARKDGIIERRGGRWCLIQPGIAVEHEPDGYPSSLEHCCFCGKPTPYWHIPKDVAVCKPCAATHAVAQVPDKAVWFEMVRRNDH